MIMKVIKDKELIKNYKAMENLEEFIEKNYNDFNNLECSEITHYDIDEFNTPEINYLIENYRFDYKDICVYLVKDKNEIWVENMLN